MLSGRPHVRNVHKGALQVWRIASPPADAAHDSPAAAALAYAIAHEYGDITDLQWMPTGGWEPFSPDKVRSNIITHA